MFNFTSFILGILAMSAFSTVFLVLLDLKEKDIYFNLAGGPCLWIFSLAFESLRKLIQHFYYISERAVFADTNGILWYCDNKWWDLILGYSDKYTRPNCTDYQAQTHLWQDKYINCSGQNGIRVSFRHSPRKFWKNYAKPIPKEEIWLCQQREEIAKGK